MKLSEFAAGLDRQILKEEFDLEKQVIKANVIVQIQGAGQEIHLHKWEYTKKDVRDGQLTQSDL